jgi:hypothetical protein
LGKELQKLGNGDGRQNLTYCILVDVFITGVPCHVHFRLSSVVRVPVGIVERSKIR